MIIRKGNTKSRRIAAIGMWDGVHAGHKFLIDYLKLEATPRGLVPSVVTFETHPLSIVAPERAPRLLSDPETKFQKLTEAGAEDVIVVDFTPKIQHMSARQFLSMLHKRFAIDALVVGFNNRFGRDRLEGFEQYQAIGTELGIEIIGAPEYTGAHEKVSSSVIRTLIEEGNVAKASKLLGHPYQLNGEVVSGQHLGMSLGFPTANLRPEIENAVIPAIGVYAAYTVTPDGLSRPTIVNIGVRPTVTGDDSTPGSMTIEAHILDYSGYLYGETISLLFMERIRDEKKFSSLDKLRKALADDARKARTLLNKPEFALTLPDTPIP